MLAHAWHATLACGSLSSMINVASRRKFLRAAPLAAGAALAFADLLPALAQAAGSSEQGAASAELYKLIKSSDVDSKMKELDEKPGDSRLYESGAVPLQITLTTEKHQSASDFEWHDGRDQVMYVVDGSTLYEIGGKPKSTKQIGPGEWHAAGSDGSKSVLMGKGDMLVIPRGTPYKRSTEDNVTLLLISSATAAK
jgi:mannose-6-phosphate isomerase-like protein (cupin superfamily)